MELTKIGDLARDEVGAFKIGPFGSSLKKSELLPSGIPVAGIENVLPNEFVKGYRRFISPQKFAQLRQYSIEPGDVLVTTMGTIGRAAVAPSDIGTAIIDSHLFRMRLDLDRCDPGYLCFALNSHMIDAQLDRLAHGAIMEGLNTSILKECVIPLPSPDDQERITALLHEADSVQRKRRYQLELAEHLFASLQHKAFAEPMPEALAG